MDNVTHTLISAMLGETAHRATGGSPSSLTENSRRNLAIGVMTIGGNLPDADLLHTSLAGGKLDYVLHHRGHTHTILGAVLLALVLIAVVRAWWHYRRIDPSGHDRRFLYGLALFAPLLHVGFDYTNSYGVHPFWPLDNRWYYGDAVFIIEPLLWACATPLVFTLRSWLARGIVALILVTGMTLGWVSGFVPPALAAFLTIFTLALAVFSRSVTPRAALASGIGACLCVTLVFAVTGRVAEARVDDLLARQFPEATTLDTVLTPMPVNPFCRESLIVQASDDRYFVRRGTHALLPGWMPAAACSQRSLVGEATAPLVPTRVPSSAEMDWAGELAMPLTLPATLARDYCSVRALLQFIRVPWIAGRGSSWIVGDLRYDREPDLGMAEIAAGPGLDECPGFLPPWVPPRQDLLTQ